MAFRLVHTKYDLETERAYVELRDDDDDGGELIATAIFSFKAPGAMTKRLVDEEIRRKARHVLRRAGASL
jgi:hypothetical protein